MDTKFKKSVKNVKRLFDKRGYTIEDEHFDEDDCYMTFTTHKGKPGKIVWSFEEKEGKQYVVNVFSELLTEPKHLILVYRNMTNYALKMYRDCFKAYFKAEFIDIAFLQKYIFDHPLVPDYQQLTNREKAKVVRAYGGNIDLFPIMLETDPVSIAMNYSKGMMVQEISHFNHSKRENDEERPPVITYRYIK